ncbi:MAG TPA: nuclear transport factor 2 family protein [Pyrinomonadaceae bacterium]
MSDESSKLSKAETEQVLMQLTDEWAKALVRGDGEALGRIMAEDFYFAYPFEGDGKEQFIDDVTSGDVKVEHLNRDNVSVRIWDRTAIATCKDSTRWFYQGHDFSGIYKVMHVYSLRNVEWQLVSVQACPIS